IRTEGERKCRRRRCVPIGGEGPREGVGPKRTEGEGEQQDLVVRQVRIFRRPIQWGRENACPKGVFGKRERVPRGVKDVCVEDAPRVDNNCPCNPRHVPDAELSVEVIDSAHVIRLERQWRRQDDRGSDGTGGDRHEFNETEPRWYSLVRCPSRRTRRTTSRAVWRDGSDAHLSH